MISSAYFNVYNRNDADYNRHVHQVATGKKQRYNPSNPQDASTDIKATSSTENASSNDDKKQPEKDKNTIGDVNYDVELKSRAYDISTRIADLQKEYDQLKMQKYTGMPTGDVNTKTDIDTQISNVLKQMQELRVQQERISSELAKKQQEYHQTNTEKQ